MKTSEILRQARGLIEDESRWMREGLTDGGGRYCAAGACFGVTGFTDIGYELGNRAWRALDRVAYELFPKHGNVANVNDHEEHAVVLHVLDRAIAIAEAEEQEHVYGDPLPDLEPAEMDLATIRTAIAAHDAREAGDSRLLTAIREATDTRVDEDREMAA